MSESAKIILSIPGSHEEQNAFEGLNGWLRVNHQAPLVWVDDLWIGTVCGEACFTFQEVIERSLWTNVWDRQLFMMRDERYEEMKLGTLMPEVDFSTSLRGTIVTPELRDDWVARMPGTRNYD